MPAAQPAAAQPTMAAAAPAPTPVSNPAATSSASASGGVTTLVVCYSNINSLYLSAAFDAPADRYSDATLAFSNYLKATFHDDMGVKCLPMFTTADVRSAQKQLSGFAAQLKPIDTGWRLGQPPLTAGQSGFDPLAQGPGGIDLSQHRLTTYFCALTAPGGTTMAVDMNIPDRNANQTAYVSQIFQADWDSAPVSMAYNVYIRDNYVHDLDPSADLSPKCSAQSPAMQAMQHQSALIGTKLTRHVVPVDFTYTSAEATGGNAAMAQVATATHVAAAQTAAATFFVSCSSGRRCGDRHLLHWRLRDRGRAGPVTAPAQCSGRHHRWDMDRSRCFTSNGSRSFLCVPDPEGLQVFARQFIWLRYCTDPSSDTSSPAQTGLRGRRLLQLRQNRRDRLER